MSTGLYEETLPRGGKLKVKKESWGINYYFPRPDLRHSGVLSRCQRHILKATYWLFVRTGQSSSSLNRAFQLVDNLRRKVRWV